jgi:predicted kinase
LVVLIGPAGSGKSTFAAEHFSRSAIVASDEVRRATPLAGKKRRADVFEAVLVLLEDRMKEGTMTVVDATNTEWMRRSLMVKLAKKYGRAAIAVVFDVPLDECLDRNQRRAGAVPPSVVRRQHSQLMQDLDRFDLEGFAEVYRVSEIRHEKGPGGPGPFANSVLG